ncbi:MAG: methylenetetrahydrofolate--tRNA-(uracil(54)-C(5))-methyltransferase (FADH(2)-oxidizing) TrmFO [Myxococcales bacterium]|nr:methylenetetrahydrofolate--tRNA-(uracil(54)-C(5))-methyltransferase (FADH(2)-oxidizing) TrmFO [Myxococcales bacterium]
MDTRVTIVGAGLAGCECAWQLAERGVPVTLIEQKPHARTSAQHGDGLAELVCSNSFRGADLVNAVGLLKEEMRRAGSLVMAAAEVAKVPAGGALAVDREVFSAEVTRRIEAHPQIELTHRVVEAIPEARPLVLATGPLTGDALAAEIARVIGREHLAYYDAIAPVVSADSIDWDVVFRASRYDKGGDAAYGNCPMTKDEYEAFVAAIVAAEKVQPREFEEVRYFEGCLPVEVMAERGVQTLAFGPMKPVGLTDPRTGERPHAVVQLRQEDKHASAYNLVGFQTRMKHPEQKRVFRMIPGLENAEFERLGSVHRNTYVDAPRVLDDELALRALPGVHLAGQISGVEGYVESAACGLVLGTMLAEKARGAAPFLPPETTALGGLVRHLRDEAKDFAPSNVVWSMVPPLPGRKIHKRRPRREKLAARALADLEPWLEAIGAARPETREVGT